MTRTQWCCALLIALAALLVRVWALDLRPAHHDEGVNGHMLDEMRRSGCYQYNPKNFHGPLQFYLWFVGQQLFGRSLWVLRMPTALVGTAVVALILAFRRFFPFRTVALAAAFVAISPAMVFYSRYAIHEMFLPFFALLACYGGFGLARGERRLNDVWCVGLGLAGMVLTKETYLLHFIAALLSLAALWLFQKMPELITASRPRPADLFAGRPLEEEAAESPTPPALRGKDVAKVWAVCLALIVAFYSGFGLHWEGVPGLIETFAPMQRKATVDEAAHHKELLYWAKLLTYYEWPALAGLLVAPFLAFPRSALAGGVLVSGGAAMLAWDLIEVFGQMPRDLDYLWPDLKVTTMGAFGALAIYAGLGFFLATPAQNNGVRWLALYAVGSFAGYSLIPYKTAWCSVNFLWAFCLVVGYALDRLCLLGSRLLVALIAVMLGAASAQDTYRLNFVNPVNDALPPTGEGRPDGERYAYVQTTFDINKLLDPVRRLVAGNPLHRQMRGVIFGEAFPLIWELNDFPNVSYVEPATQFSSYDADFLVVPDSRREEIEPQLVGIYFREFYLPRGGGDPSWLYLQAERFRPVLPAERTPEIKPRVPLFR